MTIYQFPNYNTLLDSLNHSNDLNNIRSDYVLELIHKNIFCVIAKEFASRDCSSLKINLGIQRAIQEVSIIDQTDLKINNSLDGTASIPLFKQRIKMALLSQAILK